MVNFRQVLNEVFDEQKRLFRKLSRDLSKGKSHLWKELFPYISPLLYGEVVKRILPDWFEFETFMSCFSNPERTRILESLSNELLMEILQNGPQYIDDLSDDRLYGFLEEDCQQWRQIEEWFEKLSFEQKLRVFDVSINLIDIWSQWFEHSTESSIFCFIKELVVQKEETIKVREVRQKTYQKISELAPDILAKTLERDDGDTFTKAIFQHYRTSDSANQVKEIFKHLTSSYVLIVLEKLDFYPMIQFGSSGLNFLIFSNLSNKELEMLLQKLKSQELKSIFSLLDSDALCILYNRLDFEKRKELVQETLSIFWEAEVRLYQGLTNGERMEMLNFLLDSKLETEKRKTLKNLIQRILKTQDGKKALTEVEMVIYHFLPV